MDIFQKKIGALPPNTLKDAQYLGLTSADGCKTLLLY
jgi:hypothetical protein